MAKASSDDELLQGAIAEIEKLELRLSLVAEILKFHRSAGGVPDSQILNCIEQCESAVASSQARKAERAAVTIK